MGNESIWLPSVQVAPPVQSDWDQKSPLILLHHKPAYINLTVFFLFFFPSSVLPCAGNCTWCKYTCARRETFACIEEAPSLWPPGTVCQCGLRAWAQSNASSWHCAYDTSKSLNCVQLTVMHVLIFFLFSLITFGFLHVFLVFCT